MATDRQLIDLLPLADVINWELVSAKPLSDAVIDECHEHLDWNIISATQALNYTTVNKYIDKIDFEAMSTNKNLPLDTVTRFLDRMDTEDSQRSHQYTCEMIQSLKDRLNPKILMKYQTLDVYTIMAILNPYDDLEQWEIVSDLVSKAIKYQTLNQKFVEYIINLENYSTEPLFDRSELVRYQTQLPVKWVRDTIVDSCTTLLKVFLENFPCDDMTVLTSIINHPEIIDYKSILKVQKLRESLLYYIIELHPDDEQLDIIELMCRYQMFDMTFLEKTTATISNRQLKSKFYNITFLRTLKPSSNDYLPWNEKQICKNSYITTLDFDELAVNSIIDYLPEFVLLVNLHKSQFIDFSWYKFIACRLINTNTLTLIQHLLTPLEYWFAFNKNHKRLTKEYVTKYSFKLKWWQQIPLDECEQFLFEGLHVSETSNLYMLLNAFVNKTKWSELFNHEALPDWFIELFVRFQKSIEKNMVNVSYWWKVGRFQQLSTAFIDSHMNDLEIKNILIYQNLTDAQILNMAPFFDAEDWEYVTKHEASVFSNTIYKEFLTQ